MRQTRIVCCPVGTPVITYSPVGCVMAPNLVPTTTTWADATAAPPSVSVILPRTVPVPCAASAPGRATLPANSRAAILPNENLTNDDDTKTSLVLMGYGRWTHDTTSRPSTSGRRHRRPQEFAD